MPESQTQSHPGSEQPMRPEPRSDMEGYVGSGKLAGKRALVTGGDSGIGRAVGMAFAKEGADVAFAYLSDDEEGRDARESASLIERAGRSAFPLQADLSKEEACVATVDRAGWLVPRGHRRGAVPGWRGLQVEEPHDQLLGCEPRDRGERSRVPGDLPLQRSRRNRLPQP